MSDVLRNAQAPITDAAWEEIRTQAKRWLTGQLSARRFVDVVGPRGWEFAAVHRGRVRAGGAESVPGVQWGLRDVQPLIEARAEFDLAIEDLDDAARGARDLDLEPLLAAVLRIAQFEEQAIYNGFKDGGIEGVLAATPHKPLTCKDEPDAIVEALEHAIVELEKAGVGGPFGLATDIPVYERLMAGAQQGYPIRQRVEPLFAAGIHRSPAVNGAAVLSARGGDYVLTLGQDLSIGYRHHDARKVTLYLIESFAFQVLEPAAAMAIRFPRR